MSDIIVLKDFQETDAPGHNHRLICMTGPKKGHVYYIKSKRIVLGRSKNADIAIYDTQSSREHAELSKLDGHYIISDLKSNNGIIVNQKKIKQARLNHKDKIIIGKTVFQYEVIERPDLPAHEVVLTPPSQPEIQPKEDALQKTQENSQEDSDENTQERPQRKNRAILIAVASVMAFFIFFNDEPKKPKKTTSETPTRYSRRLNLLKKQAMKSKNNEAEEKLNILIQRGSRELREGNYHRAIHEFNLALIIDSKNSRAKAFKKKAQDLLDDEIEKYFDFAARNFEGLHYGKVVKNYCQILKILEHSPEDERYKSAQENLKHLSEKLDVSQNEINCR